MKFFAIGLIYFSCFALVSCGANNENSSENFVSDTTVITDAYPVLEDEVIPIMEHLQMCTTSDTILHLPPCSNKYFRVFKNRPDRNWSEGFIVEMIPGLFNAPVHQVVIVEGYFGKYQIINQYFGHLIEMRTSPSGCNDLLIGYDDPDLGIVAIRHEWLGQKYDIVDVEDINGHRVLPQFKDSVNAIFLPAFAAGH
ncbi:MAG: hypothetical protein IPM74_02040 [Crocinitomicaceae bacterium]|nr:hypothetical protein [Crocinitomicaceae bacterium]MBK8924696.1 hypothetical protein [Crocinitomicaceae bacterium]